MKIFSQTLDTSILDTIRTEAASAFSRSSLARKVCEVLGGEGGEREAQGDECPASPEQAREDEGGRPSSVPRACPGMEEAGGDGSPLEDDGGAVRRSSFGGRSTRDRAGRDKGRVPTVERALFAVSLSGEGAAVRGPGPVSGEEPRAGSRGRSGLLVALLEGGGPGSVDRMERGGPAEEPREGSQQQPLPDPAAHPGSPSGIASFGTSSPSSALRLGAAPVRPQAVVVTEIDCSEDTEPLEWKLLTTEPVDSLEKAAEVVGWYEKRWGIEVFHRTLKSGCRIEDRQLGNDHRLEACLAIDMVVAWRLFHLTKLGREIPDAPCTVFFEEAEWKALCIYHTKNPEPPETPPTLREAIRMTAKMGGFLGRKGDGEPGTEVLWKGLQDLEKLAEF